MRTTALLSALTATAALLLTSCASDPEPQAVAATQPATQPAAPKPTTRTPPPTPTYPVIDWTMKKDGPRLNIRIVENFSPEQLQDVFDTTKKREHEPDGYFVQIKCDTTDAVLGNGKFAVGPIGAARTGLVAGQGEFKAIPGTVCEL